MKNTHSVVRTDPEVSEEYIASIFMTLLGLLFDPEEGVDVPSKSLVHFKLNGVTPLPSSVP
jgi:hypothetical protein